MSVATETAIAPALQSISQRLRHPPHIHGGKKPIKKPPVTNGALGDLSSPGSGTTKLEFECRIPVPPLEFPKYSKPIPYLTNLPDIVSWIDAFVHKAGELVLQEERVRQDLFKKFVGMRDLVGIKEKDVEYWKKEADYWRKKAEGNSGDEGLKEALRRARDEVAICKETIGELREDVSTLKNKVEELEKERDEAKKKNTELELEIKNLKDTNQDILERTNNVWKKFCEGIANDLEFQNGKVERAIHVLNEEPPRPEEEPDNPPEANGATTI